MILQPNIASANSGAGYNVDIYRHLDPADSGRRVDGRDGLNVRAIVAVQFCLR